MIYEIRHYTLHEGATDRMLTRFHDINLPLFKRHGITLENAWIDQDSDLRFSFLASFADKASRDDAWARYHQDPEFLAAKDEQATIIREIELHVMRPVDTD